jgi:acyl-CoA synthetase (AMP-forming)/AMP-acid ligase II
MYTLGDVPRRGLAAFRNNVAMVFEGNRITYKEMNDRVNRLANVLIGLGLKKGDRVTILSENTYKYMEVYFGAAKAGLSVTPLNFRLSDGELTHIINDSEASLYLAGGGSEERSLELRKDLKGIKTWISLDRKNDGYLFCEDLLKNASNTDPLIEVNENDMAILMYTGGTTGIPRGVMLSHRNILTAMYALIISNSFTFNDATCFVLPLFHIALWPVLCLLMVGGKAVIGRRPDLGEILRLIQDERCTHISQVPTILNWLLDYPQLNQFDLSSLRLITYSGSPMPIDVLKKCFQKFGNILSQGYGCTEAAPFITTMFKEDHILEGPKSKLLMSVGRAGPFVEARVVDENDIPVKLGEIGEIVVRGKNIMMGYWNNPELTAVTLRGGWLHTGDMGTIDEDGYIYLKDRKADMIITGGENVYPKETEDVLYGHSAVHECAVVSAPDERGGERVQAVVVLKDGQTVTEEELISHCKSKLAGYKCPKKIEFWDELPKTPIGKILRKDVKKHFWKGRDRSIS